MDDPAPPPRSLPPRITSSIYSTPDLSSTNRRYAFSRKASFRHSDPRSPATAMQRNHSFRKASFRSDSSIGIPASEGGAIGKGEDDGKKRTTVEVLLGGAGCDVGECANNVRRFLREYAATEEQSTDGMPTWHSMLANEKIGAVVPLNTLEEYAPRSQFPFCDYCQCNGWINHLVSKQRYHFVIPADKN